MIEMTLAEAAIILGLPSNNLPEQTFCGMSIDSRKVQAGNLFVAIPGERVDGHDFLDAAAQNGAVAALVTHKVNNALPQLIVGDIAEAMGKLSSAWRQSFNIPVVAVTGSNGKTTLKNMIASIMLAATQQNDAEVLATQGTLNNHFGLPLTLARFNAKHRYAVLEMGMNHFGEIDHLTKLGRPTVAVITNAAAAHLEGVGDVAGVARAKAEIFHGLPSTGVAILNRDDAFYNYWKEQSERFQQLTFGFHTEADVTLLSIDEKDHHLTIRTPHGNLDIQLPLLGKHNILNALAATAASIAVNIDLAAIKTGLEHITPAPGRLQLHTLANGVKIIDDTYNANPFSLQAAVETLATFSGKKILVLGDMRELGSDAKSLHQAAGENIRGAGIDYLFTIGELSLSASQAFGEGAYHFNEQEKLVTALKPLVYNQTTILVKGSRSMKMENVVNGLLV